MTWNDDDLMAYADGELAGERRAALAAALQHDTTLQARVKAFQAQRQRVTAAFDGVLDEPVPDRLAALLAAPLPQETPGTVVDLASRRARRDVRHAAPSWAQWGGMAACLCLGVALGWRIAGPGAGDGAGTLVRDAGGRMVASGALAQALTAQPAGPASKETVAVQLSFVDQAGQYCRTFSTGRLAGLACRDGSDWAVQAAVSASSMVGDTTLRQAASPLPRAVLDLVDARIAGSALTAAEEQAARARGWKPLDPKSPGDHPITH